MNKPFSLYGPKRHPFWPDIPTEMLYTTRALDSAIRRVGLGIADGGFAMLTGDPGTAKSATVLLLDKRASRLPPRRRQGR